jgi:hypothetical protein
MVGPWTDHPICKDQISIIVRCAGCGARFSTKNIGWRDDKNIVTLARHTFAIYGEDCTCKDPNEFPWIHDCAIDHIKYDWEKKIWIPTGEDNVPRV